MPFYMHCLQASKLSSQKRKKFQKVELKDYIMCCLKDGEEGAPGCAST